MRSIDISRQKSRALGRYLEESFDYVVTICDEVNEACLIFPGAKWRLHWSLEDCSRATGSEEKRLEVFQSARDKILEHTSRASSLQQRQVCGSGLDELYGLLT